MREDLRFPIGGFDSKAVIIPDARNEHIATISALPGLVRAAVEDLDDEKLDTEYRPGGWTIRQVVHHIADSHINSYCRFKLALTEDCPIIRTYHEDRWAETPDNKSPVDISLTLIDGVHSRWTALLEGMTDDDFDRRLNNPESGEWTLNKLLALYDWHSRHHLAHITDLKKRMGW